MNKNTIRPYVPTDKPIVLDILRLNTPAFFSPEEEADLIHYLDNEIDEYFVIEVDGTVVGSGGINFSNDRKTGIISWDMIHPDYHGKGLGGELVRYRIERLQQVHHVDTIIVRTSQLAYAFYQKMGFVLVEVVKDYWAEGYDLYRMEYKC